MLAVSLVVGSFLVMGALSVGCMLGGVVREYRRDVGVGRGPAHGVDPEW